MTSPLPTGFPPFWFWNATLDGDEIRFGWVGRTEGWMSSLVSRSWQSPPASRSFSTTATGWSAAASSMPLSEPSVEAGNRYAVLLRIPAGMQPMETLDV